MVTPSSVLEFEVGYFLRIINDLIMKLSHFIDAVKPRSFLIYISNISIQKLRKMSFWLTLLEVSTKTIKNSRNLLHHHVTKA